MIYMKTSTNDSIVDHRSELLKIIKIENITNEDEQNIAIKKIKEYYNNLTKIDADEHNRNIENIKMKHEHIMKNKDEQIKNMQKKINKTFIEHQDVEVVNDAQIKLEEESKIVMNDYFNNIEERFELELIKKFSQIIKIVTNEYQKGIAIEINRDYYKYLESKDNHKFKLDELKENNRHIEVLKDKEIELKKLDCEMLKIQQNII